MKNHIISKFLITCTLVFLSFANRSYSQIEISITFPDTYEYIIDISREKGKEPICIRVKKDFCDSLKLVGSDGSNKNIFPKDTNDQELIYQLPSPSNPELPIYKLWLIKTGVAKDIIIKVNYKDTAPRIVPPTSNTEEDNITEIKRVFSLYGNFDRTRVIYVYDFNKNMSRRGLYKVYKKKTGREKFEIVVERVNINKETLTPCKDISMAVININRLIYDVHIADTIVDYESIASSLFDTFFSGNSVLLGNLLDQSLKFENIITSDGPAKLFFQNEGIMDETEGLLDSIIKFYQLYLNLREIYINAFDPCYTFPECQEIDYYLIIKILYDVKFQAHGLNQRLDLLSKKVKTQQNELIVIDNYFKQLDEIELQKKAIESSDKIKTGKSNEYVELLYNEELIKLKIEQQDRQEIVNQLKESTEQLDKLSELKKIIDQLPSEESIQKEVIFLNNVIRQNQTYLADNISLKGNMLELKIDIKSNDSISKKFGIPKYDNSPIELKIPVVWKPFVTFSSGVFAAIGKNLLNKTYDWQYLSYNNTIDTTHYTLVESGYTTKPFGLSALGNIEIKTCRNFGFGISTGVGMTIEQKPRFAYLAGGSLFLGDMRQFAVTGGFIIMPVDHITDNYKTIADNQVIYSDDPDVKYYKEIKTGIFLSVSYTPFKYVKSK